MRYCWNVTGCVVVVVNIMMYICMWSLVLIIRGIVLLGVHKCSNCDVCLGYMYNRSKLGGVSSWASSRVGAVCIHFGIHMSGI